MLQNLQCFLVHNKSSFLVDVILVCGLVARTEPQHQMLADSTDGVGSCRLIGSTDRQVDTTVETGDGHVSRRAREQPEYQHFLVAYEVKTLTSCASQAPAREFDAKHGTVVDICVNGEREQGVYMKATMKTEYRTQCLHHAACIGVSDVIFVVASPSNILYVARLHYPQEVRILYIEYLQKVKDLAFDWIGKRLDIPDEVIEDACENDDGTKEEAFSSFYQLCRSLEEYRAESKQPIAKTLQIRPRVALGWNELKGGTTNFRERCPI